MKYKKFKHVARGKGPAYDVFRLPDHRKPTRYRFKPGLVMHKGKMARERLGFVGR